ncbi:basic helix-loop-helix protein A-like [Selaginella moellendorffii]|uniref:basic helix-loop-helix protein A-like n=1 Tax=Selaginella moellendorffii TaxID=88036 RepID=UPI000D1CF8B8|nr:basic helix-loop-helix protein A-like [Selaginella moellendorffii]|eukprot:XP_024545238.1 basic helix-loop-helix protein A-like [Selaginella moellendorffii]
MVKPVKREGSSLSQFLPVFLDHGVCPLNAASINPRIGLGPAMLAQGKTRTYAQRINHIWSERERRKELQGLYDRLRSLLPTTEASKMDRCGVVQETMELIQSLKNQVQELSATRSMLLEHRKSAAMDPSKPKWNAMTMAAAARSSASVGLHICKSDVFVNMSCRMQARLLLSVLWILRQHQLIVQDASVSVDDASRVACICIRAKALDIDHFAKESLESSLKSFVNKF